MIHNFVKPGKNLKHKNVNLKSGILCGIIVL